MAVLVIDRNDVLERNNNFSSLTTYSIVRSSFSRFGQTMKGEVISRKGLLVPVIMSAFQAVGYWLEVITIPYKLSNILTRRRANTLRFDQIYAQFATYGKFAVVSFPRNSTSNAPERIKSNYINVYTEHLYVNALGIYEQLRITYQGGRVERVMQPIVVVAHSSKDNWRNVISYNNTTPYSFGMNSSLAKAYVADEFDKVYTWDTSLRNKIRTVIFTYLQSEDIPIVKVPMDELREAIIYKPDFSKLNPFEGNHKMLRDVATINNYYSPLR